MGRFRKRLRRAVSRFRTPQTSVVDAQPQTATPPAEPEEYCCEFLDSETVRARLKSPPKLLLVNHWATWCEGCVEELPLLVELHKKWGDQVDFVGVSWEAFQGGSGVSLLREVHGFSKALGLAWDSWVLSDSPDTFFETMSMTCQTIPQIWLVTTDGEVAARFEEVLDLDSQNALDKRIGALLDVD